MHPYVYIAVLFIIANIWKQPICPSIDEWIMKMYMYTHWSITQALKRIQLNN